MSDSFDLSGLLNQAQEMQAQMAAAQEEAARTVVEGVAGGGAVKIRLTGGFDVEGVELDPSVVDPDEIELLTDLIHVALRDAIGKAVELQSAGMPDLGGMDLGGLGGLLGGA